MRNALGPIATLTLLGIMPTCSWSAVFSSRATVSSYVWQHEEIDTTTTRHLQNTGTLGLRLARIGGHDLEIATTLRGSYDKISQGDDVDDYRVHDLFARWRNLARRVDLVIGRHRPSWPSGNFGLDGASADIGVFKGWEIGGYVGSLAPDNGHFATASFDEGHAFGARVGHRSSAFGAVFLSFSERRLAREYDGRDVNTLATRSYAVNWRRPVSGFGSLYGHLLYDGLRRQVGRAHFTARWDASPTLSVQGEYRYRRPSIAYNSIFWVFGASEYAEGRARLHWRATPTLALFVGLAQIDVSGDDAQRFDLGVSQKYFSVILHGKSGAPGATIGVSGDAMYPIDSRWTLRGGANYSSYELIEDQAVSNSQAALWGGVRWQAMSQAAVDLETQFLTHDITTMSSFAGDESEFRVIARIAWWFFQRLGEQHGQS